MVSCDDPEVEAIPFHAFFVEAIEVVLCIEVGGFEEGVIHVHAFHCIVSPLDILKGSRIEKYVLTYQRYFVLLLSNSLTLFLLRIITIIQLIC